MRFGLMTSGAVTGSPWCFLDNVTLADAGGTRADSFEDGDFTQAEGAHGLTWAVLTGAAAVSSVSGRGVGFGAGSIVETNPASLGREVVQPPAADCAAFDFHLLSGSRLRDAGADAAVPADREQTPRPFGTAADIGPYEYVPPPAGMLMRVN